MTAAPRKVRVTLLLPKPRDCGRVPARPRKSSHDRVAAAFQGLWKIRTHIWRQASPLKSSFQHQWMWPFSRVCWDLFLWGGHTASTRCPPSRGTTSPHVAQRPPGLHSAPGDSSFAPEHRQVSSCGVAAFALPLFTVLMKFKPSPFSLFSLVPAAVSNFLFSLQLLLGRGAFPICFPLSPVSVLSPLAKGVPYLLQLLAPQVQLFVPSVPDELCGSGCADCCVNLQSVF